MRSASLIRIATLALFFALASSAGAQQMGSIVGLVTVARGNFPEPIMVSLQTRGATIATTYTDGEGRFDFSGIYANVYHIVISDDLYQPVDIKVELNPDIQSQRILQITLTPRQAPSQAVSGPYVISSEDLTRKYPKGAVEELQRGLKSKDEGKLDDAIRHFEKAIRKAPDMAMAHSNLGAAWVSKSDFPAAQKELAEAIRLNSSDAGAYFNMANLMLLTRSFDAAAGYLAKGFRLEPQSAFGSFVQGSLLERTGKLPEAEAALKRALALDPKLTRPHLELVNLYLHEQRRADAIAELRNFLAKAPKDPLAPKVREVLSNLEHESGSAAKK